MSWQLAGVACQLPHRPSQENSQFFFFFFFFFFFKKKKKKNRKIRGPPIVFIGKLI